MLLERVKTVFLGSYSPTCKMSFLEKWDLNYDDLFCIGVQSCAFCILIWRFKKPFAVKKKKSHFYDYFMKYSSLGNCIYIASKFLTLKSEPALLSNLIIFFTVDPIFSFFPSFNEMGDEWKMLVGLIIKQWTFPVWPMHIWITLQMDLWLLL